MTAAVGSSALVLLAISGWGATALVAMRLRRTRDSVGDAVHELARPLTALALGLESRGGTDRAAMLGELERARAALSELACFGLAPGPGESSEFDLGDLAREITDAWTPIARSRAKDLSADVICESSVRANRGRIGQAACSLVANAIEHGEGPITISVVSDELGSRIEVKDAGGGGDPRRPSVRGRGRGLALARRAVAESGGSLLCPADLSAGGYAIRLASEGERGVA